VTKNVPFHSDEWKRDVFYFLEGVSECLLMKSIPHLFVFILKTGRGSVEVDWRGAIGTVNGFFLAMSGGRYVEV
jgi:hypothetical protein